MLPEPKPSTPPVMETPKREVFVTVPLAKLIDRIQSCALPTMFMLYVGGDGEPKLLFSYQDVKREDLAR